MKGVLRALVFVVGMESCVDVFAVNAHPATGTLAVDEQDSVGTLQENGHEGRNGYGSLVDPNESHSLAVACKRVARLCMPWRHKALSVASSVKTGLVLVGDFGGSIAAFSVANLGGPHGQVSGSSWHLLPFRGRQLLMLQL